MTSRVEGSGRVGGTQFDDKVVSGRLSQDVELTPTEGWSCDVCGRVFVPERAGEHLASHD